MEFAKWLGSDRIFTAKSTEDNRSNRSINNPRSWEPLVRLHMTTHICLLGRTTRYDTEVKIYPFLVVVLVLVAFDCMIVIDCNSRLVVVYVG